MLLRAFVKLGYDDNARVRNAIDCLCDSALPDGVFSEKKYFYRSDKTTLIFDNQKGWDSIDVFYPFKPTRVGIQNIVEAFSTIGLGNNEKLNEAWLLM